MDKRIENTRSNSRSRRTVVGRLNNYRSKVMIDDENRYLRAKDAMYCALRDVPDEQFKSLCCMECVLGE